jgi:magnesium-transporting ATPase (P-type)
MLKCLNLLNGYLQTKLENEGLEIAIIKQFAFSSSLLRMSVLCKTINSDHLDVYCKGAPEKIYELCKPETSNFFLFFVI